MIKTTQYKLPAYWASALVNGDYSGCDDADERAIDNWLAAHPELGGAIDCSEAWFSWSNDANNLGGDVCNFTFPVLEPA